MPQNQLRQLSARSVELIKSNPLNEMAQAARVQEFAQLLYDKENVALTMGNDALISNMSYDIKVEKGHRFYHATPRSEWALSIITNGIKLDMDSNFSEGRALGNGLYLSKGDAPYATETSKVLVFEVDEDVNGIASIPLADYIKQEKWKNHITKKSAENQWNEMAGTTSFIQNYGLPPADTEVLLRNPINRMKVVGVIEMIRTKYNGDLDIQHSLVTPIDQFLARNNNAVLHESWDHTKNKNLNTFGNLNKEMLRKYLEAQNDIDRGKVVNEYHARLKQVDQRPNTIGVNSNLYKLLSKDHDYTARKFIGNNQQNNLGANNINTELFIESCTLDVLIKVVEFDAALRKRSGAELDGGIAGIMQRLSDIIYDVFNCILGSNSRVNNVDIILAKTEIDDATTVPNQAVSHVDSLTAIKNFVNAVDNRQMA